MLTEKDVRELLAAKSENTAASPPLSCSTFTYRSQG
jgi:hypothetical protein